MKMRRGAALGALALSVVGMVAAYRLGRARADGVPMVNPLYYGGMLEDGGRPVEGARNVTVRLWDAASAGATVCTTNAGATAFSGGRFRVALDGACVGAVRANPELWAELQVEGTTFPRSKLGAVPYALEAGRATGAAGALEARINELSLGIAAPGTIVAFGGPTPPAGWLLCDGAAVSRATYRRLFDVLNTSWGSGDGAMTFNVPDMRGRFIRGVDTGVGRDPEAAMRTASNVGGNTGDRVGTAQTQAVGGHSHEIPVSNGIGSISSPTVLYVTNSSAFTGVLAVSRPNIGAETRPINVAVNYIVKF